MSMGDFHGDEPELEAEREREQRNRQDWLADNAEEPEEQYLRRVLTELHQSYTNAAKPFIDRLVAIQCCKPLPPIILTTVRAPALGLRVENFGGNDADENTKRY